MTDLEMVKKCAEAAGIKVIVSVDRRIGNFIEVVSERDPGNGGEYDPLSNDAQAMALVKKFQLDIAYMGNGWIVMKAQANYNSAKAGAGGRDLNRAICECVAKMEKS